MKVRALESGFYGGFRRRAGDTFDVAEGAKAKWFTPVRALGAEQAQTEPTEPKTSKGGKGKKQEPNTLSEMARNPAAAQTMVQALAGDDAGEKGNADIA